MSCMGYSDLVLRALKAARNRRKCAREKSRRRGVSRYHHAMTRVLFVTAEASPYAQTGGLGEVCGSLPKQLAQLGCEVRLLLPAYGALKARLPNLHHARTLQVVGHPEPCTLLTLDLEPGLELWLLDAPQFFDRPVGPYTDEAGRDWHDNPHRFACFSRAAAQLAIARGVDEVVERDHLRVPRRVEGRVRAIVLAHEHAPVVAHKHAPHGHLALRERGPQP